MLHLAHTLLQLKLLCLLGALSIELDAHQGLGRNEMQEWLQLALFPRKSNWSLSVPVHRIGIHRGTGPQFSPHLGQARAFL